jgi:hypothetical protein
MIAIGLLFVRMLCDFFKPRPRLEAEILVLRHQLNVLQQRTPRRRLHLRWIDRGLFIWGAADRGGIPVGHGADLFGARQRSRLRSGLHKSNPGYGDSRPPDITEVALAESLC